jgi:hypothetical protein
MLCKIENCDLVMFGIKMANISKLYNYQKEQTDEEYVEQMRLERDGHTKCILLPKRDLLYVKSECTVQELFDFYTQGSNDSFKIACHRYDSSKNEYVHWQPVTELGKSIADFEKDAGSKVRLVILMEALH